LGGDADWWIVYMKGEEEEGERHSRSSSDRVRQDALEDEELLPAL
jgi:hypothetical protein